MLLIDYFKTCWLLNILCIWWRHVGDQKYSAPSRLFHCWTVGQHSAVYVAVLASEFISSMLVWKCGQYYREVLLVQELLLIIRVQYNTIQYSYIRAWGLEDFMDYFIFKQDSISILLTAQRRRPNKLNSASNQTASRRYCGPVQIVRPQPSRSQDIGVLRQLWTGVSEQILNSTSEQLR